MNEDKSNLDSASETARQLVEDLMQVIKSDNPYLQELTIEMLEQVCKIEQKLLRLRSISEA